MLKKKSYNHNEPKRERSKKTRTRGQHVASDDKKDNQDKILQETAVDNDYRFYRTAGLSLSATIIVISGALLNWSITNFENDPCASMIVKISFYWLALFYCMAISYSLSIQYYHYLGYQAQARKHYPPEGITSSGMQQKANVIFSKADTHVEKAWKALLGGFVFSILFFFWK